MSCEDDAVNGKAWGIGWEDVHRSTGDGSRVTVGLLASLVVMGNVPRIC